MPKFIIDVELYGYDAEEEMLNPINECDIRDALEQYDMEVIKVERIGE